MCTTCGCGGSGEHEHMHAHVDENGNVTMSAEDHDHDHHEHDHHDHDHAHPEHSHAHTTDPARAVSIEEDILSRNNQIAAANREYFREHRILALNFVSSPGSGKTELLAKTLEALKNEVKTSVIEGDLQTNNDADRIRATGTKALQINTGSGCHLDAHMIAHAMEHLKPEDDSVLFIENVGNLVCPAEFDLGEAHKVVLLSVTEGDDKPLKYPTMFRAADLMILTKTDLLEYVPFDADKAEENARRVNPKIRCLRVSSMKGTGMDKWLTWLKAEKLLAGI
jgi:hydrogenase nickel incorporation protein HypB